MTKLSFRMRGVASVMDVRIKCRGHIERKNQHTARQGKLLSVRKKLSSDVR